MTEVAHKDHAADDEPHNFRFYCRSDNFATIIQKRMKIFGTWGLIGYVGQFILIVAVVNVYSDMDRFIICPGLNNSDDSAAVYDSALRLLGAYHIIEWVRFTIFLVTMLLGQNFMPLWYATAPNTIFGIVAYIYAHVIRYSGNGVTCASTQKYRADMLMAEVIVFWVTFFVMSIPQIFIAIMSNENLDSALVEEDEDDD